MRHRLSHRIRGAWMRSAIRGLRRCAPCTRLPLSLALRANPFRQCDCRNRVVRPGHCAPPLLHIHYNKRGSETYALNSEVPQCGHTEKIRRTKNKHTTHEHQTHTQHHHAHRCSHRHQRLRPTAAASRPAATAISGNAASTERRATSAKRRATSTSRNSTSAKRHPTSTQ